MDPTGGSESGGGDQIFQRPMEAEAQGAIQHEEESPQEEDRRTMIHLVAVLVHLHLHLQVRPRLSRQEEQDSWEAAQELRPHLHRHLQHSI